MSVVIKRLTREYNMLVEDETENISAAPIDSSNLLKWEGIIIGPRGTPYEGGVFKLEITFPSEYPFRPPKIKFDTQVFHPNINRKGEICLDILRDKWSSSMTIRTVLLSISSLLDTPNPEDPLVPEIADLYKRNRDRFEELAKEWTVAHAT